MRFSLGSLAVAAALLLGVNAFDANDAQKIKDDLKQAGIIPNVLEEFEPLTRMKITYNDDILLDMGMTVEPKDLVDPPHIWFKPPTDGAHYTLALIDADSETPLVRHWVAINIEGNKPGSSFRDQSKEHQYTPYHGPTPPAGTGKHRYVFALFEQQQRTQAMLPVLEDTNIHRANFSMNQFAHDNNLKPVAAVYMTVEHQAGFEGAWRMRRLQRNALESASAVSASRSGYIASASVKK